jgi:Zn-dependent protease with chaperone function
MSALPLLLLKISFVLAIGLAAMPLLRGRAAATRHAVLVASLIAAALVPLLQPISPAWGGAIGAPGWVEIDHRLDAVIWIWAAGTAVHLSVLAIGLLRLRWLAAGAEPVDARVADAALEIAAEYRLPRPVSVLAADRPILPGTWGHWRPAILLPLQASTWDDERVAVVLRHELAHVQRRDWLLQLIAALLQAVLWFNPLVWLVAARLRRESEYACDARVLAAGLPAERYSSHLLALAREYVRDRLIGVPAPGIARSMLEARIRMMLTTHRGWTTTHRAGVPAALAFAVMALAVSGYGSRGTIFGGPPVVLAAPDKPITLTLLLDGRLVDLSKPVPPLPNPNAGIVPGISLTVISSTHIK